MKRWPELRVIKPRSLEVSRAKSASHAIVQNYFNQLEHIMDKYELQNSPHLIFNVDEKGISTNNTPYRIVAGSDFYPQSITTGKSQTIKHHSHNPGHLGVLLTQRSFPELFGPDCLRREYSYFGAGKLNKTPMNAEKKTYLQRYLIYLYPELQEDRKWKDTVVCRVNEVLRRPAKSTLTIVSCTCNKYLIMGSFHEYCPQQSVLFGTIQCSD